MKQPKTKTITFIKPWGLQPKGATITVNTPIADLLIRSKRAVEVAEEQALACPAPDDPAQIGQAYVVATAGDNRADTIALGKRRKR